MMRIGLVYDRFGDMPAPAGAPPDWDAEFEPEETIAVLESAVRRLGHEPVRIGNPRALLETIAAGGPAVDAAINIAEGYGGRNREAYAPVLLEIAGVPFIGSDALTLSTTLDKHLAKLVIRSTTVATPPWQVVTSEATTDVAAPAFPVIVKPRYEGAAKGIASTSRCDTTHALRAEMARQHASYRQDLIVEAFVEGAEYTVAVVGHPPTALPVLQRATERETGIGVHALADQAIGEEYEIVGVLTPDLERRLQTAAILAHELFECRDFSRSDFRVDGDGALWFLEINPLPTFAPDGTLAIIAELTGRPYDAFLADVLGSALGRIHPTTVSSR